MSTDESDNHCGYRQDKSSIERFDQEWDREVFVDTAQWDEDDNTVVCLRDPWTDHDRCIWHAETKDKSANDFKMLRANGPERLDGAYLADVELDDRFSFDMCWLRGANLLEADLSGATLGGADLSGADLSSANLFKIDIYSLQIDDIGDITVDSRTKVSSRIPLRSGFRHVSILLVWDYHLDIRSLSKQATRWDRRARGYERLRRVFQEKGLDEHHRKLYSYQRRARAKGALRTGRFIQWIGNYLSRILTGHGVRITRVLLWTAVVILVPWYWYGLVEGWANESLEGGPLYYSIVTFVTSPPYPIPDTQGSIDLLLTTVDRQSLNQGVVLFQTYVGTVLIILLGYVLGNRDPV